MLTPRPVANPGSYSSLTALNERIMMRYSSVFAIDGLKLAFRSKRRSLLTVSFRMRSIRYSGFGIVAEENDEEHRENTDPVRFNCFMAKTSSNSKLREGSK